MTLKINGKSYSNLYQNEKQKSKAAFNKGYLLLGDKKIKMNSAQTINNRQNNETSEQENKSVDPREVQKDRVKEVLEQLQKALVGEDSEERYQEILRRAEKGEDISEKDLAYLKSKDPKTYYEIKSEIEMQKQFEERLKQCKSKDEANNCYIMALQGAERVCGLKGKGNIRPNRDKFKRLVKRLNKVWEKYKKGKLDKKEKVEDVKGAKRVDKKSIEKVPEDLVKEQYIKAVQEFQQGEEDEVHYSSQG